MNDVKTWADIDASPLLQLPPEQRKKLHDANDERFRTFWAECFLTTQLPEGEEAWNSADFCKAFLDAFDLWEPKPGQTFSMYLRTAVRHAQSHDQQQEEMAMTGFGRETNRKIKKALEYMEKNGITESMLCRDPEKEQVIADIVGVGVKTCGKHCAISSRYSVWTTLAERIRRWVTGWLPKKKAWKSRWSRAGKCWHGCTAALD